MNKINIDDLKECASGNWLSIFCALAPELDDACQKPGRHVRCLCHGEKDGFRLFPDANEKGGGVCNLNGPFHDGISLLMWVKGWNFVETLEAVARYLGLDQDGSPSCHSKPLTRISFNKGYEIKKRSEKVKTILKQTSSDPGRISEYLEYRGLSGVVPNCLRFCSSLSYFSGKKFMRAYPAIVAPITFKDELVGIHRIWLDPDGLGKAPVESPKKTYRCAQSINGGAVKLYEVRADHPLVLTEGVETAIAIHELSDFPVWACLTATGLEKVVVPSNANEIWIACDKDRNGRGERAAQILGNRLWEEEKTRIKICVPPMDIPNDKNSVDWLDVLRQTEVVYG